MRIARSLVLGLAAALATALAFAPAVSAGEPKCPLPLHECLTRFSHMRERPWLGAWVDSDSVTGDRNISKLMDDSPATRAGLRPGDVLKSIGGVPPATWFAGKAGWKTGDHARIDVVREGKPVALELTLTPIPEEVLAQIMGAHVLEGHIAYGDFGDEHEETHQH
jgi:predicted metalloprotease with PDZ domain